MSKPSFEHLSFRSRTQQQDCDTAPPSSSSNGASDTQSTDTSSPPVNTNGMAHPGDDVEMKDDHAAETTTPSSKIIDEPARPVTPPKRMIQTSMTTPPGNPGVAARSGYLPRNAAKERAKRKKKFEGLSGRAKKGDASEIKGGSEGKKDGEFGEFEAKDGEA